MTIFENMRILTKIALALVVLIVISLAVSTMSYQSLSTQEETARMTEHTHQVMGALNAISMSMVNQETGIRGFILSADEAFLEPEKAGLAAYTENMAKVRRLTSDNPAQQRRLDALEGFVETWRKTVAEPELALMKNPATGEQARQLAGTDNGKASMDGMRASIQEMIDIEEALLLNRTAAARAAASEARLSNIAGGTAMIFFAILALIILNFGLVRHLRGLNRTMRKLADGETAFVVLGTDRKDEVGEMAAAVEVFRQAAIANRRLEEKAEADRVQAEADRIRVTAEAEAAAEKRLREATSGLASGLKRLAAGDLAFQLNEPFAPDFEALRHDLNGAVEQLAETLRSVTQATTAIDNGSREISQSADDLSKRTEQQAASLEETAAALDQITANVTSSSRRAEEARTVAVQANASAVQSGKVVANAVDAMQKIEQSSNQVSNIIGVIDEIAFQTNLLALNAGVEAARAGEAGKGFAVVAQEVRELAQRSAQAAKEIKELIRKSSVEVQSGVTLVQETGEALKTIEGYIITVNQHMDAIAISAKEQSVGLGEVNTAVNQMDNVTQQNAAMVEETSAAGATLANESGRLRELISQFQLGGSSRQTASVRIASNTHRPVGSPVRALTGKVANAFSGNTVAKEVWEDF